jgi:tetratricopeptide (TPR) repeat protein
LPDAAKRVQVLDNFVKAYPEAQKDNAAQLNNAYFLAYQLQNDVPKILDYGEKTVASDPNNLLALNTLAFLNAFGVPQPNAEKAADYAQKARTVAEGMKKPEGVDEAVFKQQINNELGKAHLVLGYAAMVKAGKSKKMGPAIEEFKTADSLLEATPALEGQALYYLGNAYEIQFPANHRGAIEALSKAETLAGPFQGPSHDLLAKVRAQSKL